MITLEQIKEMYEEKVEMERRNCGIIRMMLNKEDAEVWNAFFVNENNYIIYNTDAIVEIPFNQILDIATKEKGWILRDCEIVKAIKKWCDAEVEKTKEHA